MDNIGIVPKLNSDKDALELKKNFLVDNEENNSKSTKIMSHVDLVTTSNSEEKISKKISGTSLAPLKGVLPLGHLPPLTAPLQLNSSTA